MLYALIFHRMQQKVDMKTKKRVEQVDKLQKKLEDLRTTEVNELWENIIRKRFEVIKMFDCSFFCIVHLITYLLQVINETLLKELKSGLQDGSFKSIDVLRAFQWNALKSHLIRNNIVWVSYKCCHFLLVSWVLTYIK